MRTNRLLLLLLPLIFVLGIARAAYAIAYPNAEDNSDAAASFLFDEESAVGWAAWPGLVLPDDIAVSTSSSHPFPRSVATANVENLDLVGHLGGGTWAVATKDDDYAYVGSGPELAVMSLNDLKRENYVTLSGFVVDILFKFNYVYAIDGNGLTVFTPAQNAIDLSMRGYYETPGRAWDVAIPGDSYSSANAFVADGYAGLRVIDVTPPDDLREIGYHDTPGVARGVAAADGYAYVADSDYGLRVIDISDPINPQEVGYYDTPGVARDVAVVGDYAYVADGTVGLRIVDISTPTDPQEIGYYDTPGDAIGVTVAGGYAYVADDDQGMRVIDVGNPSNPQGSAAFDTSQHAVQVTLDQNMAYLAAGREGLWAIDVGVPMDPQLMNQVPGLWFHGIEVAPTGDYAYAASGEYGLQVIDVDNPTDPQLVGSHDTPGEVLDVVVAGDYAYVADDGQGLRVMNVITPSSPLEVGYYDTPGEANGLALIDSYVCVVDGAAGLRVVDVSDPTVPQEVGGRATPGEALGVAAGAAGTYVYLADGKSGLRVIDVNDPADPQEVGAYDTPGVAQAVAVVGSYAYVADGTAGLQIVDVSDPAAPQEVGAYDTLGEVTDVTVMGPYAYVADESDGLRVLDVSTPSALQEIGYYDIPEGASGVAATEDWIYVVGQRVGLFVLRHAGTRVGGTITTDSTWTVADSPYVVASDVEVQDGSTLTIEPGVTVRFDGGKKMQVNGGLVARGTTSKPITFTSNQPVPEPGDWGDIEFTETAITTIYNGEAYTGGSVLQYCVVEYGGYNDESGYPNGTVETTQVLIDHCTIRNNVASGIYARGTIDTPARITYNTIHDNSACPDGDCPAYGGGIYALHSIVRGNRVTGNSAYGHFYVGCGGGIYASSSEVISNMIQHNNATGGYQSVGYGGGIYAIANSRVADNTIEDNSATGGYLSSAYGGGIYASDSIVMDNSISGNSASGGEGGTGFGGGLYVENSTVTENIVDDNKVPTVYSARHPGSGYGGGIYAKSGSTVDNNIISGNSCSGYEGVSARVHAGGIYAIYSTVADNFVYDNAAHQYAGGIYGYRSAIIDNIVSSNTASWGGGIYATSGSSVLTNTIAGNAISTDTLSGQGSGVYLVDSDALVNTMKDNVVIANTGPSGSTIGSVTGGVAITGTPQVHDNDFYDNIPYDVVVLSSDDVSGTLNYWGTTESTEIKAHIFDCGDDGNLGCFLYDPFRSEASPGAPLPPPTNLTTAFEPGQVALSWKSLPGFQDRLSYTVYYDTHSSIPPYDGVGLEEGNSPIAVGDRTGYTLTGLASDVSYYFAVTAHDDAGRESWYSNVARGEAEGYTAFISPSGGSLVATANDITFTFPADTVSSTVVITLSPQLPQPTGDLVGVHRFYNLTAVYSETRRPAQLAPHTSYTVTIGYADHVPVRESTLKLYGWEGAQWSWKGITSTVNINTNRVIAQVDHLSRFAVLGEAWKQYLPLVMKDCRGH